MTPSERKAACECGSKDLIGTELEGHSRFCPIYWRVKEKMPYITKLELGARPFQTEKTITEQITALLINSYFVIGAPVDDITPGGDVFLKVNAGACVMHLPSARFIEITELVAATPKGHVVKPVKLSVEVRFF